MTAVPSASVGGTLGRFLPGLPALLGYDRANLRSDVMAGLSVAAVALPVGVAYSQLAGLPPVHGLYASILPLVAYALFGTSRQLVMGPDAATCALVAATVAPLAGGDKDLYLSLTITLTLFAGLFSFGGRFLKLGGLADFLSKPILVGFLNGISLSILLGQAGKLLGFTVEAGGIVPRLLEIVEKLPRTHLPTLAVGATTFVVLAFAPRLLPAFPRNLVAMVAAAAIVALLGLDHRGVAVLGVVPSGLPRLAFPSFPVKHLPPLIEAAAGLALVSFTSMMLTARSFASKNGYELDADREFAALGAANIAAAFSSSFAVSGADSRTAVSDAAGGKTQVTGLVAAGTLACVLLFLTGPLRYVPVAALGAVLMLASISLVDLKALRMIWQIDRVDLYISVFVTLGVVAFGAIDAILVAVSTAIIRYVRFVSRPKTEVLGTVPGLAGFHGVDRHPRAETTPGLVLFRFNGPVVFFNAPQFRKTLLDAVDEAARRSGVPVKWIVLDMVPIPLVDATGLFTFQEVIRALRERGATLVLAGRKTELQEWRKRHGIRQGEYKALLFPSIRKAAKAFEAEAAGEVTPAQGEFP